MQRHHAISRLGRVLLPYIRRRRNCNRAGISSSTRVSQAPLAVSHQNAIRDRWDVEVLASCAARKQVRVSLDAVLDVSTGRLPWRASFKQDNADSGRKGGVSKESHQDEGGVAGNALGGKFACTTTALGQLQSAQYLHRELPVRLASAILELDKMKDTGLPDMPSVRRVRQRYLQSFWELQREEKPVEQDNVGSFTVTLKRSLERTDDTVLLMARGLQELMLKESAANGQDNRCGSLELDHGRALTQPNLVRVQSFLDSFYQNRVAMRFLAGHYLALCGPPRDGRVGLVQRGVRLSQVAQAAVCEAASICSHALGSCPGVRMVVDHGGDCLGAAVPEYVYYVVLELVKNAMRATMQAHGRCESTAPGGADSPGAGSGADIRREGASPGGQVPGPERRHGPGGAGDEEAGGEGGSESVRGSAGRDIKFADVPEVTVAVSKDGADDVLLVVSDRGGGIRDEEQEKVWSYLYTTAGQTVRSDYLQRGGNDPTKPPPLAGLGYGLPLSRLYARSFGGDLTLRSRAGGGTDAVVRLSRRGTRLEPLVWPPATDASDKER